MGKASSKHKVDKPELVLELFKKAGHTHHIKPGHVLIEQGKESESLFLVVSGELVLKRGTKELARRGVGQLLGEMSFLLGSKPGVTVVDMINEFAIEKDADFVIVVPSADATTLSSNCEALIKHAKTNLVICKK